MDASDAELARRIGGCHEGAAAAEGELFRRFAPRIRSYGLRHLHGPADADDLVQQVLIVVIERLRTGELREPDRLASFILGTCRLTAQGLKAGRRRRERLLDWYGQGDGQSEPTAPLDLDRLRRCLERLAPRQRTIVVLTFYGERSGEEIAAELEMTSDHVRVARHRALGSLQDCMERRSRS